MFKLTPIGTTVYRGIAATDLDAGRNKDIDFAIVPGDGGPVSSGFLVTHVFSIQIRQFSMVD